MTTNTFNSGGLGQFFHAEKLAVDARKNEVKETCWIFFMDFVEGILKEACVVDELMKY